MGIVEETELGAGGASHAVGGNEGVGGVEEDVGDGEGARHQEVEEAAHAVDEGDWVGGAMAEGVRESRRTVERAESQAAYRRWRW